MIIVRLNGGLGNQLFQYAIGRSVAERHNNKLLVDLTDLKKTRFKYSLGCLLVSAEEASSFDILRTLCFPRLFYKAFYKLLGHGIGRYYVERERTVYDPKVFDYPNIYLRGYWQNDRFFSDIRHHLLKEFRPRNPFSESFSNYSALIQRGNSVSLHVRRGDYLRHSEIGVLDPSYYKKSLLYLMDKIAIDSVFVFSNDIAWCKDHLDTLGLPTVFVENTRDEFEDLFLMSLARHNIIANSSFSWWGAWLNENSQKIVVSPLQWVKCLQRGEKWVPDSWVQL